MRIECIRKRLFRLELHHGGGLGAQTVIQFRHVLSGSYRHISSIPNIYLSDCMVLMIDHTESPAGITSMDLSGPNSTCMRNSEFN
jgi:hypothetical protein